MSQPVKETLSFMEQLRRYWFIIIFLSGGIISIQMQINANANTIEQVNEWRIDSKEDVKSIDLVKKDLEYIAKGIGELKTATSKIQTDFNTFKEEQLRNQ